MNTSNVLPMSDVYFSTSHSTSASNTTPTTVKELTDCFMILLPNLYEKWIKNKDGATFSLRNELKKANIYDQRFRDFLQDMNIIEKRGRARGTRYFWNKNLVPNKHMAIYLAEQWEIWKNLYNRGYGKDHWNRKGLRPYPKGASAAYQGEIFDNDHTVDATIRKEHSDESDTIARLKTLIKNSQANSQKRSDRWHSLMKKISIIELQNREILRKLSKPVYVRVPVFFGLFTIKRKINFKQ